MTAHSLIVDIAAPREVVFNFLADIENLPAWTPGFCEWLELHRTGWWAYTALGEFEAATEVRAGLGEIVLRLKHVCGREIAILLRVERDSAEASQVALECELTHGFDERLFVSLENGLGELAACLQPELAFG